MLDIRLPIGSMFTLIGVLLTAYGILGHHEIYERSLGINVNVVWGLVLIVFGVIMWSLGRRKIVARKSRENE